MDAHRLGFPAGQRVAIARTRSARPKLMVLDGPVPALEVGIRVCVLNLPPTGKLSCLLIALDLANAVP